MTDQQLECERQQDKRWHIVLKPLPEQSSVCAQNVRRFPAHELRHPAKVYEAALMLNERADMAKELQSMTHPETGVILYRAIRPVEIYYGQASEVIDLPGWFPEDPKLVDMGILGAADGKIYDRAMNKLKAMDEGLLPPADVRRVRRKLRIVGRSLSQKTAGEILCADTRLFRSVEAGDEVIPRELDCILRILDQNPAALLDLPTAQLHAQKLSE